MLPSTGLASRPLGAQRPRVRSVTIRVTLAQWLCAILTPWRPRSTDIFYGEGKVPLLPVVRTVPERTGTRLTILPNGRRRAAPLPLSLAAAAGPHDAVFEGEVEGRLVVESDGEVLGELVGEIYG